MKILPPLVHGLLDYSVALVFFLVPTLFNFSATVSMLVYVVGTGQLIASLLTAYPLGVLKLIPFPIHGVLESVVAVGLIGSPWLLGFASETSAQIFFIGAGVALLVVVAITDYKGKGTGQNQ